MSKFAREKRGLTQDDVARKAGVSRATVGFLELFNVQKVSLKNLEKIFKALSLHPLTLKDPSLYEIILEHKTENIYRYLESKYGGDVDTVVKVFSVVFDVYGATLNTQINTYIASKSTYISRLVEDYQTKYPETIPAMYLEKLDLIPLGKGNNLQRYPLIKLEEFITNTGFPKYLPSIIIYDILNSLSQDVILSIFSIPEKLVKLTLNPERVLLFEVFIFSEEDPFLKLMRYLNIPFIDYFEIIKKIINAPSSLKTASFESLAWEVPNLINEIQSTVFAAEDREGLINAVKLLEHQEKNVTKILRFLYTIKGDNERDNLKEV